MRTRCPKWIWLMRGGIYVGITSLHTSSYEGLDASLTKKRDVEGQWKSWNVDEMFSGIQVVLSVHFYQPTNFTCTASGDNRKGILTHWGSDTSFPNEKTYNPTSFRIWAPVTFMYLLCFTARFPSACHTQGSLPGIEGRNLGLSFKSDTFNRHKTSLKRAVDGSHNCSSVSLKAKEAIRYRTPLRTMSACLPGVRKRWTRRENNEELIMYQIESLVWGYRFANR